MTTLPEVGEVVVLTELDSEPRLLVCAVDDDEALVVGTLLADLADETIQRLNASVGDRDRRREVTTAVARADELMTFAVPVGELRHRGAPGIQGCRHPTAGDSQ